MMPTESDVVKKWWAGLSTRQQEAIEGSLRGLMQAMGAFGATPEGLVLTALAKFPSADPAPAPEECVVEHDVFKCPCNDCAKCRSRDGIPSLPLPTAPAPSPPETEAAADKAQARVTLLYETLWNDDFPDLAALIAAVLDNGHEMDAEKLLRYLKRTTPTSGALKQAHAAGHAEALAEAVQVIVAERVIQRKTPEGFGIKAKILNTLAGVENALRALIAKNPAPEGDTPNLQAGKVRLAGDFLPQAHVAEAGSFEVGAELVLAHLDEVAAVGGLPHTPAPAQPAADAVPETEEDVLEKDLCPTCDGEGSVSYRVTHGDGGGSGTQTCGACRGTGAAPAPAEPDDEPVPEGMSAEAVLVRAWRALPPKQAGAIVVLVDRLAACEVPSAPADAESLRRTLDHVKVVRDFALGQQADAEEALTAFGYIPCAFCSDDTAIACLKCRSVGWQKLDAPAPDAEAIAEAAVERAAVKLTQQAKTINDLRAALAEAEARI